jgi:hypothetical protein
VSRGVRRVTWQVDRSSRRGSGVVYQPCVQDTLTIALRGAQDRGRMASKLIGTLLSSQVTDARTTRPGTFVPIGCDPALSGLTVLPSCCFALSFSPCFASDLSRSAAAFAISCDFDFRLISSPSALPILADRFCVSRFHLAFVSASGLSFRCGAPELYRYLFPAPNRPFAGCLDEISNVPTPGEHDAADAPRATT